MNEVLKFQDFQSRLNQEFHIEQESEKWIAVKLVEASELKLKFADTSGVERTSFALVFRAGSDVHLSQSTYTIKHEELGEHQIFLVPIQPDEDGTRYEAVFT
jgi:hypothetical protein